MTCLFFELMLFPKHEKIPATKKEPTGDPNFPYFRPQHQTFSMKILIVEDEPFVAEDLIDKLEKLPHEVEVTGVAESYEAALEAIAARRPDLALVDIELKGKLTGIDLSEQLNRQGIHFIYISSLEDLDVYYKAKTTGPVEYLPKPVNTLSLRNALMELESAIATTKSRRMHFFHDKNGIKKRIDADQIVYIKAGGMYCHIFFADDTKWMLSVPMGNVVEGLDHPDLLKIHRSYIINRKYITQIQGSSKVKMSVGPFLTITKPFKESFSSFVNKL